MAPLDRQSATQGGPRMGLDGPAVPVRVEPVKFPQPEPTPAPVEKPTEKPEEVPA